MVQKVIVAQPRGFCAGVEMAIKALSFLIKAFESPIYCYHEIVHNQIVVDRFRNKGVIFVDSIEEVPANAIVMLSAHGSAPQVVSDSKDFDRVSINAVCPLVTKVHHEAKTRTNKGFEVIYVGHEGHDEALGTMAVAPDKIHLVTDHESLERVSREILPDTPIALLAQTTLAMSEWETIADSAKERFPGMWTATKSDLCFATTNRQTALKELVKKANVLLIIGSSNSSNTLALEKVAREQGCERVYRIDSAECLDHLDLKPDDIIGVTAGASAPEDIVQEVIAKCDAGDNIEYLSVINEDEYFPPPSQLRNLVMDINFAVASIFSSIRKEELGEERATQLQCDLRGVFSQDRHFRASESLV